MAAAKIHPRKRLFVNREIQGRLLARTALYWMLYHGVLWMAMFLYRYAEHRGAVQAGAPLRPFADLYGQFVNEHYSMWVCAVAILPIVLWDLLKFSHRVVGPLVPFQRAIERSTVRVPSLIRLVPRQGAGRIPPRKWRDSTIAPTSGLSSRSLTRMSDSTADCKVIAGNCAVSLSSDGCT